MRILKNSEFLGKADIKIFRTVQTDALLEHRHEFVELFYCVSGSGSQEIGCEKYPIVSGGLYLIGQYTPHKICAFTETEHYDIIIRREWWESSGLCGRFTEYISGETASAAVYFSPYDHKRAIELLVMMEDEQTRSEPSALLIENLFYSLLSIALRSGRGFRDSAGGSAGRISKPQLIDYVNKHCCENITITDIAKLYGYNSSYLSRYFRQICGMPYTEYVNRLRMNRARALLKTTNYAISQISGMLGYRGSAQFYSAFSKHYGVSPNRFRTEYHKEKLLNNIESEDTDPDDTNKR